MSMREYACIDLTNTEPDEVILLAHQIKDEEISRVKQELMRERERQGLTQREVGETAGIKTPNVTRLEASDYAPSLVVLERYALALGKVIRLELVDAER